MPTLTVALNKEGTKLISIYLNERDKELKFLQMCLARPPF